MVTIETSTSKEEQFGSEQAALLRYRHVPVTFESEQRMSSIRENARGRKRLNQDIFSSEQDY